MLGRVIDNSLFSPSVQDPKLIALILNYNLPTQTHKLLQKGTTAVLCIQESCQDCSAIKFYMCCSADVHLCRWRCKQAIQCCPKLCTAPVSFGSSQAH